MTVVLFLQYFNQILTAALEVLDDSDSSVRELALSLILEMLNNQVFGQFWTNSLLKLLFALLKLLVSC